MPKRDRRLDGPRVCENTLEGVGGGEDRFANFG